ncbi:MBL fold metallo-hydrolase [Lactobacillus sp.]|uniref:MBL fold metallo-hydrolase n=1 Tax=Lactobacillus sp. TaxID=1591 RepID=UPI0019B7AE75|nr:MBL fold metallo-hydrolase [Lactobacillus sp.]MBD5429448.1 MBL fold metallo-hydrolase [Lactobacillus sp.]
MQLLMQPVVNVFQTSCYFFIDEETKHGFLIDPGAEPKKLIDKVRTKGWIIDKILLTHGHFDHSYAAAEVSDALNVPVVMNKNAVGFMDNDKLNLAARYHQHVKWPSSIEYSYDGEVISGYQNSFSLKCITTPGHTPDSQIFYSEKYKFALVGDMIYNNDIGLTEFPKGDEKEILNSITNKICKLPNDTYLFNGHTAPMTVQEVRDLLEEEYGIFC